MIENEPSAVDQYNTCFEDIHSQQNEVEDSVFHAMLESFGFNNKDNDDKLSSTAVVTGAVVSKTCKSVNEDNIRQPIAMSKKEHQKIAVLELFKLTKALKQVFGPVRGVHGEYLTAQEFRGISVDYIKNHSLENPTDRSQVVITSSVPLHAVVAEHLRLKQKAKAATESAAEKKTDVGPAVPSSSGDGSGRRSPDIYDSGDDHHDCDDDDDDGTRSYLSAPSLSLSDPWAAGSASNIGLRIHKDGLKVLGDGSATSAASRLVIPAAVPDRPRAIAGSSSVGGWGVDKGTQWKAVSLPKATPAAPARKKKVVGGAYVTAEGPGPKNMAVGRARGTVAAVGGAKTAEPVQDLCMRKDELFKALFASASPYSGILGLDGRLAVHSGALPKVRVHLEMRAGNKAVTILRGLSVFNVDLAALTKDCQKKFACGVSHGPVPGVPKEKEVVLQGNFSAEIEGYLHSGWGVPPHLIEITAGKNIKIKKKK